MQFASVLLVSVILTLLLIPIMAKMAKVIGLVDQPTSRKQHVGVVPLVGGLSVFFTICVVSAVFNHHPDIVLILQLCGLMLFVGLLDDYKELPTSLRLVCQIIIAGLMVGLAGVKIFTVGNLVGYGDVAVVGLFSSIFTVICVVGVVNAINMIDGVDGLAGTTIALSFIAVTFFSFIGGQHEMMLLALSVVGAYVGFLYFNSRLFRPRGVIFLGDAGSMCFGLLLVWFLVRLTQGADASLSAVAAGWIFGFPLADTVSVMVGRLREGRSPLKAGRDHAHHRMLDMGFSPNQVILTVAMIHGAMIITGIICSFNRQLEPVLFWAFVIWVVLHHFYLPKYLGRLIQRFGSEVQ